MITSLLASKAYAAAQAQVSGDLGGAAGPAAAAGTSFGDVLNGVMSDTIHASRQAEQQMVAGVQGKADLVNVVTAVSSAETSLQTLIAVRDQVISAYQQVMAMQICGQIWARADLWIFPLRGKSARRAGRGLSPPRQPQEFLPRPRRPRSGSRWSARCRGS